MATKLLSPAFAPAMAAGGRSERSSVWRTRVAGHLNRQILALMLAAGLGAAAAGQTITLTRILDSDTQIPFVPGSITTSSLPAHDGGLVAFRVQGDDGYQAILRTNTLTGFTKICDTDTLAPNSTETFDGFVSLLGGQRVSIDGLNVAFPGHALAFVLHGNYSGSTVAAPGVIVDSVVQCGGGFTNSGFSIPSRAANNAAFRGLDGQLQGFCIYRQLAPCAGPEIACEGFGAPDAGVFEMLGLPMIDDDDNVVFPATTSQETGIYLADEFTVLAIVADTAAAIPGGTGNFTGFGEPSVDDGEVAFVGLGDSGQIGVYLRLVGGQLITIADTATEAPDVPGFTFTDFGNPTDIKPVSISDGNVAFYGSLGFTAGLYTHYNGSLIKIVRLGDELDGVPVAALSMQREALDGDSMAFLALLSDGTVAIYLALIGGSPADLDGDGDVDINDFLTLLAAWGRCGDCADCPGDVDGDCDVGIADFLALLAAWG